MVQHGGLAAAQEPGEYRHRHSVRRTVHVAQHHGEQSMAQPEAHNFRLISHDTMSGFGNVGEGMSLQLASGGRRIMWMAHECAPKNFTGVDVTDPTKPRVIVQTDLPHRNVRSNSLEVCGDIMAVAYQ